MNTAIINLRLYPPTNAMIMKTIERLHDTLQNIFIDEEALLLAESDKNLLISGEMLTQKNQQKPQVAIFLMLMVNWGIKSITFNRGLEQSELSLFLEMLGKKPDDVIKEKGLREIISEGNMPHIQINQKIFVEADQDRQIVSSIDIKDDEIIKFITTESPDAALDPDKLKELAKDPLFVSRIFQSGIQHLSDTDGSQSKMKLSESMLYMLQSLDKITDHLEKEKLSSLAAKSISDMDADFIAIMLTQNMEGLLENRLFNQIVDSIDHNKFEQVAGQLYQATNKERIDDSEKTTEAQQAYEQLMNTEKGIELKHHIEEKQAREKEERENRIQELKKQIDDVLNKFEKDLFDENDVNTAAALMIEINQAGEIEITDNAIERLTTLLMQDRSSIRNAASQPLAAILDNLSLDRRNDLLIKYWDRLVKWIALETSSTDAFRNICMMLKDLVQIWIRKYQFAESTPLLQIFSEITSHTIKKNEDIRATVSETLRELMSSGILDILIDEFRTDKQTLRNEAGKIIIMTAEQTINPLLDLLLESDSSSERVLILNLIPEMGSNALPSILSRVDENAPWYYLRNLARLLGRIGNEEQARTTLSPLLLYGDLRVQKEAMKSINSTGGSYRGEIFLNALSGCDDQLKVNIVTALGSLKHRDALKPLLELFKSKLNLSEEMKVELQEKICLALGNIGDKEALPFLKEVSTQSGIFGFKSYHQRVKAAAGRAAAMISKP